MANVKLKGIGINQFGGAEESGNQTVYASTLSTNSTGAALNSNSTAALGVGDKVYLQSMPAGMRLDNAVAIVSTAFTAAVTGSLGFEYLDGVDSSDVPQDAAYFGTGIVLSTAARLPNVSSKELVTLPKEAYLVLTIAGAANAKVARLDVLVTGERLGAA